MIKGLTIHQPWAEFIVAQHKVYETRSWATRYRGNIAIHAGKTWDKNMREWTRTTAKNLGIDLPEELPVGCIVGVAKLVAIYNTELLYSKIELKERKLGNYETGRYAWRLELVEVFDTPIFCAGQQGLWDCNLDELRNKAMPANYVRVQ